MQYVDVYCCGGDENENKLENENGKETKFQNCLFHITICG